jgi:cytochrome P450
MIDILINKVDYIKNNSAKEEISPLTNDEIMANMKTFYLAGSDATSVGISWITYILALYPTLHEKVAQEVRSKLLTKGIQLDSRHFL